MASDDADRAAILARRQRLILAALGSISSIAGCASSSTSSTHVPDSHEREPNPTSRESVVAETLSTQELLVALRTLDLPCAELMVKPLPARDELLEWSEELVEALIERIEHERDTGGFACALEFAELGSYYAPGSRALALLSAEVAIAAGDCRKSRAYLDNVERLAEPNAHAIELARVNELRTSEQMLACAEAGEPDFPRIQDVDAVARPCLQVAPKYGKVPIPVASDPAERRLKPRSQKKCLRPKRFW